MKVTRPGHRDFQRLRALPASVAGQMSADLVIERLTRDDIEASVALARAVGWGDVESDWRVIHEAALVLGVRHEGVLIAQGALAVYRTSGTIAKMIVAPAFQRRGVASRILDALMQEARRRSLQVLGLVATEPGRPLYERRGFSAVGDVVVLTGTPRPTDETDLTHPLNDAFSAARLEERWMGFGRRDMLRARVREAIATSSLAGPSGELSGYAVATAQGLHALVGPVIAETEAAARTLASAIFRSVAGPIRIDIPGEQQAFRAWLEQIGLHERIVRPEMASGATRLPWQVPQRYALAGQAWG